MFRHIFRTTSHVHRNKRAAAAGGSMIEHLENRLFLSAGPRLMENLDRGVVATRASSTQVFVSWRSLALDSAGTGFNVYRSANGGAATKLNTSPLTGGANFSDTTANATLGNSYFVKPVINGVEQAASRSFTLSVNAAVAPMFSVPLRNITGTPADFYVQHTWVGDLDGDREYEFVVARLPSSETANRPDIVEAYKRDGTLLWTVEMGPNSFNKDNIEPSSSTLSVGNWDGLTVYHLDSDGKAEVAIRTAHGVVFGDSSTLSYPTNNNVQFISVLNGMTGAERARFQVPTDFLADGPMAASMGIGYLDGVHPSLLVKIHVWSSRDGVTWTLVATVAASSGTGRTVQYTSGSLASGTWYKVTSYNAGGDSTGSNVGSLVIP